MARDGDGDKKPEITFERVTTTISLLIALLAYVFPPDPAHPKHFDLLFHTVSFPLWLLLSATFGLIALTSFIVGWWTTRKTIPTQVVAMSANLPTRDISYLREPSPGAPSADLYQAAPAPAIITVELKTVAFEIDITGLVIVLTNRGGSEARHIQVEDVHVAAHTVRFSGSIESLKPGASSVPQIPCVIEFKERNNHEIGEAMYQGIISKTWGPNERYDYQGGAHFYDVNGRKWQASWIFTFFPHRYKEYVDAPPDDRDDLEPYLTVSRMSTMLVD
jgi:hypothetical protein